MKPVYQTKFGGSDSPEEEQGNCMAACLASIFECSLEEVPDFSGKIVNNEWYPLLRKWLIPKNLDVMLIQADPDNPPPGIHIQARKSTTLPNPDDGHMVVVKNGQIIHDPNPRAESLGDPEEYWVFIALDPAQ